MEGGVLAMSQRERTRLVMMTRVREKAMTIKEAAEVIGKRSPSKKSNACPLTPISLLKRLRYLNLRRNTSLPQLTPGESLIYNLHERRRQHRHRTARGHF